MKDSIERIRNKGNSFILLNLARRVDDSVPVPSNPLSSGNMVLNTTVNHDLREPNTFIINDDDDFYEKCDGVEVLQMIDGVCNDPDIDVWKLNVYSFLRELIVGSGCVHYVKQLKLTGLARLERIQIGSDCFKDGDCEFEIRNCLQLKIVSIGDGCFVHCKRVVYESEGC